MKRFEALKIILESLSENQFLITTTGMISREAFAAKDRSQNFYMIGSMGLVTPLALGIALNSPSKKIVGIEGDGSMFLNLGSLPVVGFEEPRNLLTIVLDNGCYESTGCQPSISSKVDLEALAKAAGYKETITVTNLEGLGEVLKSLLGKEGPGFLLIKTDTARQEGTPRVSYTPEEIKERFRLALTS